jgi:hypothetical protein
LKETLVEHFLEDRTQRELASRLKISQSTVSRQIDAGLRELRARLRTRGVLCGTGMVALLGGNTAHAAPASLHASLGKLAISGAGSSSSTPVITTAFFTMNVTKIALIAAAAAVLISPPLLYLRKGDTLSGKSKIVPPVKATDAAAARTPTAKVHAAATASARPELPPVSENVRFKVDGILRRHRGLSKAEMLRTEEMQQIIDSFCNKVDASDPDTLRKSLQARDILCEAKGLPAVPGCIVLHTGDPDSVEFRAWMEAAVSDDSRHAQVWMLNRLEGAVFEFVIDPTLEQSSGGISLNRSKPASYIE